MPNYVAVAQTPKSIIKTCVLKNAGILFISLVMFSVGLRAQIIPQEEPIEQPQETQSNPEFGTEKQRPAWLSKVHYGGNIWAGFFGTFYLDFAPMVGYEVTSAGTIAGLGATFVYQGQFQGTNSRLAVGPKLFVRQPLFRSFFAHLEYEFVNADEREFYPYPFIPPNDPNFEPQRKWGGSPLIGLGLYQGRNRQQGGSFIAVMYNLGYPNSGYINPQGIGGNGSPLVLRFGFFI